MLADEDKDRNQPRNSQAPQIHQIASPSGSETKLEMVERHVEQGAGHVTKQKALIARLRIDERPTQEAEALLVIFESIQCLHEGHLARLRL